MINVLFEAPVEQYDGWGVAANKYLSALNILYEDEKIDLSIKPLRLSNNYKPQYISTLYENEKYDVVIQNTLPHLTHRKCNTKKNIGLFYFETARINNLWVESIKSNIDQVIVSTKNEFDVLQWYNIDAFQINMPFIPPDLTNKEKNEKFTFYFIGTNCTRKNLFALINCYYSAFDKNDNVLLLIKTNGSIEHIIEYAMKSLRKHSYPKIILTKPNLSDEEIKLIHESCHCFVMPSYGESTCIPLVDALLHNNLAIITKNTGMDNFNYDNVLKCKSYENLCCCTDPPLPFLYSYEETWTEINKLDLVNNLKKAKDQYNNINKTRDKCVKDHDINIIAKQLYETIRS